MIIKLQNVIGCVPFSIHKVPPTGWKYLGRMPIGEAYQHKATSLTVISSIDTIENGNGTSKTSATSFGLVCIAKGGVTIETTGVTRYPLPVRYSGKVPRIST